MLWTTREYSCGCKAEGPGDVPNYCPQHDVVHAPLCATRQRSGPLFDPVPPPTGACNCGAESGLELESDALARKQGDMIFTGSRPMPETMIDHARASWDSVHVDVDDYRDTLPGL